MITRYYYSNPDNTVAYQFVDDDDFVFESGGLVDENSVLLADEEEFNDVVAGLEILRLANIAAAEDDWIAQQAVEAALRASARTKLINGTPLTEEEANLVMGIFGEE